MNLEKYATYMALINLINRTSTNIDERNCNILTSPKHLTPLTIIIILLKKLNCYGIQGFNLQWFENYLDNRTQFVSYN